MTKPDRQHLRDVASKATPGPWEATLLAVDGACITQANWEIITAKYDVATEIPRAAPIRREADATHIAAFDPPTVLALLDQLDELEAEVERLREALLLVSIQAPQATDHPEQHERCWRRMKSVARQALQPQEGQGDKEE